MPQRLKALACGVFDRELRAAAERCENEIEIELLDAGLHAAPNELRRRAQEAIDRADVEPLDAVLLCYGMCGRGIVGLRAKSKPIVIPRAHDCIAIFLGSRHEYRRQFAEHPGTYYITSGWFEKKSGPQMKMRKLDDEAAVRQNPKFAGYAKRFGDDNAAYIVRFFDQWKKNYSRAAFIDHGLGEIETYAEYTREIADEVGWEFERLQGSLRLIEMLLAGDWPRDDFLVVPPGHKVIGSGKNDLFESVPMERRSDVTSQSGPVHEIIEVAASAPAETAATRRPSLGLGIDAGGTYTDSALYDFEHGQTLCTAKALTTPHDYAVGIVASVQQLDADQFAKIEMVCLSTTLATNAIVEGRGGRVGLLLMPHLESAAKQINVNPLCIVPGRIDITGRETAPLDETAARQAIARLIGEDHVDAIAISGFGGTMNPKHELRLKALVADVAQAAGAEPVPVVCGHELSSRLDFIKRAHTAALNAKLLPVIQSLIDSVKAALRHLGIDAAVMVVKGDGTLVSESVARQRPIETILSGPAASATGAVFLTGEKEAVAIDMGGTTTDTALIKDGRVAVSPEGAQVGPWRTSVDAVDMLTTGLGGDSLVSLDRDGNMTLGPQRVVPLAYLASQSEHVEEELDRVLAAAEHSPPTLDHLDFFVLVQANGRAHLDEREREIADALAHGPRSRLDLTRQLGYMAPSLLRTKRLEELGYVRRAAATPTYVLHYDGEYVAWDRGAAAKAMEILATILHQPAQEVAERIRREIVRRLSMEIIRRYVSLSADPKALESCDVCRLFLDNLFEGKRGDEFACRFEVGKPIVGIGAPAQSFMPAVAELLSAQVLIPEHADVANAIGAITSKVVVSERATIRPSDVGDYLVHTSQEKREFETIADARTYAERAIATILQRKAPLYGTDTAGILLRVNEREGKLATGEQVFLEMVVEGSIEGQPVIAAG